MISLRKWDNRPIYEQVRDEFRRLIVAGGLPPGVKLDGIRELSVKLAVNPNTIQRAYRELERGGYICTIPGKGSFVSEANNIGESRRSELFAELAETARELKYLGADASQIISSVEEVFSRD